MSESKLNLPVSSTLNALLWYAKRAPAPESWKDIATFLSPMYFDDMSIVDVVSIVMAAYDEALSKPEFLLNTNRAWITSILAPIKGANSIEFLGPTSLSTSYSIETWYLSILKHVLSELRIATVVWQ